MRINWDNFLEEGAYLVRHILMPGQWVTLAAFQYHRGHIAHAAFDAALAVLLICFNPHLVILVIKSFLGHS